MLLHLKHSSATPPTVPSDSPVTVVGGTASRPSDSPPSIKRPSSRGLAVKAINTSLPPTPNLSNGFTPGTNVSARVSPYFSSPFPYEGKELDAIVRRVLPHTTGGDDDDDDDVDPFQVEILARTTQWVLKQVDNDNSTPRTRNNAIIAKSDKNNLINNGDTKKDDNAIATVNIPIGDKLKPPPAPANANSFTDHIQNVLRSSGLTNIPQSPSASIVPANMPPRPVPTFTSSPPRLFNGALPGFDAYPSVRSSSESYPGNGTFSLGNSGSYPGLSASQRIDPTDLLLPSPDSNNVNTFLSRRLLPLRRSEQLGDAPQFDPSILDEPIYPDASSHGDGDPALEVLDEDIGHDRWSDASSDTTISSCDSEDMDHNMSLHTVGHDTWKSASPSLPSEPRPRHMRPVGHPSPCKSTPSRSHGHGTLSTTPGSALGGLCPADHSAKRGGVKGRSVSDIPSLASPRGKSQRKGNGKGCFGFLQRSKSKTQKT